MTTLTGICIEDWKIDYSTSLRRVNCDYFYMSNGKKERRPNNPEAKFSPGEFIQIVKKQASRPMNNINQNRVINVNRDYNETNISDQAKYAGHDFHDNSGQRQTLAEAAVEIQNLLKQLEETNPTATEAEKIAYVNDETTPSFKRRAVGALQAGGETAIEEFLDNSYVNIGKAIIKGWMKPE